MWMWTAQLVMWQMPRRRLTANIRPTSTNILLFSPTYTFRCLAHLPPASCSLPHSASSARNAHICDTSYSEINYMENLSVGVPAACVSCALCARMCICAFVWCQVFFCDLASLLMFLGALFCHRLRHRHHHRRNLLVHSLKYTIRRFICHYHYYYCYFYNSTHTHTQ